MRRNDLRKLETTNKLGLQDNDYVVEEMIGPDEALEFLRYNTQNRRMHPPTVARYAADMVAGRWNFIGDPIRLFSVENDDAGFVLIDGQHRLQAVVNSKRSQRFLVVYLSGTRTEMLTTIRGIDKHRTRTMTDDINISKEEYGMRSGVGAATLTTAVTALAIRDVLVPDGLGAYNLHTTTARQDAAKADSGAIRAAVSAIEVWRSRNGRTPLVGYVAAYLATWKASPVQAVDFWERVTNGAMLEETDPRMLLREKMIRGSAEQGNKSTVYDRYLRPYRLLIRAWNLHCLGQTRAYLRATEGDDPEPMRHPDEGFEGFKPVAAVRALGKRVS